MKKFYAILLVIILIYDISILAYSGLQKRIVKQSDGSIINCYYYETEEGGTFLDYEGKTFSYVPSMSDYYYTKLVNNEYVYINEKVKSYKNSLNGLKWDNLFLKSSI